MGSHRVFLSCFTGVCHYSSVDEPKKFEEEESHLFQTRHQVEAPRIYNGHIQKTKKHSDVPPLVSTSVGVHCQTLVNKLNPTHVLIVKGHRELFLDHHHCFFPFLTHLLATSSGDWPAQDETIWTTELSSQRVTAMFALLQTTQQATQPISFICYSLLSF